MAQTSCVCTSVPWEYADQLCKFCSNNQLDVVFTVKASGIRKNWEKVRTRERNNDHWKIWNIRTVLHFILTNQVWGILLNLYTSLSRFINPYTVRLNSISAPIPGGLYIDPPVRKSHFLDCFNSFSIPRTLNVKLLNHQVSITKNLQHLCAITGVCGVLPFPYSLN
jgi:hypothetical protein